MKHWLENEKTTRVFGDFTLNLFAIVTLSVLLVYAYQGTFTRYWADDFCFTQYLKPANNIFSATLNLYNTWSNRYTTMLLVGISELSGQKAISYIPALMIFFWLTGLTILIDQVKTTWKIHRHRLSSILIAFSLAFLTILQTPDRFQSIYWRSGLVTYFAPLVFQTFGAAFILHQVNTPGRKLFDIPAIIFIASLFFLSGGLSETTLAMQIGAFFIAILAAWFLAHKQNRKKYLVLLISGLAASLVSLIVVLAAPGNGNRLTNMPERLTLMELIPLTLQFSWDFIWLSIKALPIPTIFTLWLALLLALDFSGRIIPSRIQFKTPRLLGLIAIISLTFFALILCATAPSVFVFGKFGYPIARALFSARFSMTAALFTIGLLVGLIVRQHLPHKTTAHKTALALITSLLLAVTILYPMRTVQAELASIPTYQKPAIAWDNRDAQIRTLKAAQINDITIERIGSPALLSELNPTPSHWVNRCVAKFYDLNTIAVFPN